MRSETVIQIRIQNGLVLWIPGKHTWLHMKLVLPVGRSWFSLQELWFTSNAWRIVWYKQCLENWLNLVEKLRFLCQNLSNLIRQLLHCFFVIWSPKKVLHLLVNGNNLLRKSFEHALKYSILYTPPKNWYGTQKWVVWMMMFLFERLIFRFHVTMRVFWGVQGVSPASQLLGWTVGPPVRAAETW